MKEWQSYTLHSAHSTGYAPLESSVYLLFKAVHVISDKLPRLSCDISKKQSNDMGLETVFIYSL